MTKLNLTSDQVWTAINALHTTSEAYKGFAQETATGSLVQQFERQSQEALELSVVLEDAE